MIIAGKKNLERKRFKNLRKESTLLDRKKVEINVKLYVESLFEKGKIINHIGIYWPIKNEIDIRSLNEKYSLALPRCEKNKEMVFCRWDGTVSKLTEDCEGIPSPDYSLKLNHQKISIIFTPCLAVDRKLTRLGYGGGYFDRLRKDQKWRAIPCIGVLTSNCVSDHSLIRAEWDIPLSGFITENEILV